jgi:Mce-associated membrane protein
VRPSRRRSTLQPARRPRVAGQHSRRDTTVDHDLEDGTPTEEAVSRLDGPVIGEDERTDTDTTEAEEPKPKSRPAGKRRSTGVVPPTAGDLDGRQTGQGGDSAEATEDDAAAETTEDTTDRKSGVAALFSGMNLAILLAVLAVGLAVLAFWFRSEASDAESGGSNVALTDSANTAEVSGQVRDAVNTIFSYSYTDIAKTTNAAKNLLIGDAVGQYDQVMQKFTKDIEAQRIQVTVTTVNTGVVSLSGDHARVLVFADQIAVRADQQPAGGPTQFVVEVQRQDGRWKIVGFDFFDGGQPK